MSNQFTEQDLVLSIGDALIERPHLTINDLIEELFPENNQKKLLPSVIESFVKGEFYKQSKNVCRFGTKNFIAKSLQSGSSEFIKKFIEAKTEEELIRVFPSDLSVRLKILKDSEQLGSLLVECTRIFNRLREKFAPSQSEDKLRLFLADWFQSGLMPLSIWKKIKEWHLAVATLNNLKNMKEPDSETLKDPKWIEFKRLLKAIRTDNFIEPKKLQTILSVFFTSPQMNVINGTLRVSGTIMYLSEWLKSIQDTIKSQVVNEVAFYIEYNLTLDCNLTDSIWQGKNLIVVSQVVNVSQSTRICLSGASYAPCSRKATSAMTTQYKGADGRDGRAGESSGNLAILSKKMFNSQRLTVELNGGRGEDGEDGGDGCDGKDGVGVSKSDIDRLIVSYSSLYREPWSKFYNYDPPSNWKKETGDSSSGDFIHRRYVDENDRKMTYSFAGDKGWTYTTYEIYFLIQGSNGTSGTSGGSNGVGGQGGYNGTCTVKNPETNEEYPINIVREGKSSGVNGKNGIVGKSGRFGVNGNDMVLIDRSANEASKHYIGDSNRKLDWCYVYKAEYLSRLNGIRRYRDKENACFIKFNEGEKINTSEMKAEMAKEETVRKTSCEAVAKQSIVLSKVMSEAESLFGKQSQFLSDALQASSQKASLADNQEEVAEEATETVNEEVVIIRQKEVDKKFKPIGEKKVSL